MTIDFWGLGLQAINVLILIWLLSRVFWRPVAAAIAKRQETTETMMQTAQATQARADAAIEEVAQARDGIATERTATLDAAKTQAETASKAALAQANTKAEAILAKAKTTVEKDAEAARKANAKQASDLSLVIAARLLERLNGPAVQSAFLAQLVEAIKAMPTDDRAALADDPKGIEIVIANDTDAGRKKIEKAVQAALGGSPDLRFVTDPDLIAGLELRSPHFVLHNSWQADLTQVRKAVNDAS
jgi:F-type H+-transporting ATPase subunit b